MWLKSWTTFCLVFLCHSLASSAPLPATSSSAFVKSHLGLFRSSHGFELHAGGTDWIHASPPRSSPYIVTLYRAPQKVDGVQAALTVRVDELEKPTNLKSYTKRWMKDYPRFGFNILAAQKVKVGSTEGFLVDVLVKPSERQLRQVVFMKDRKAVILTCRDSQENFMNSLSSCNAIINNFRWL